MIDTITTRPFTPTIGDYCRFHFATYYLAYRTPWRGLFLLFFCIGLPAVAAYPAIRHGHYAVFFIDVAAFSAVWLIALPLVLLVVRLSSLTAKKALGGPRVAEISPAGIRMISDHFDTRLPWRHFHAIFVISPVIGILSSARNGILIREDAFPSGAERNAFITTVTHHIHAARHKQVSVFYDDEPPDEMPRQGRQSPPFFLSFATYFRYYLILLIAGLSRPVTALVMIAYLVCLPMALGWQEVTAGHWRSIALGGAGLAVISIMLTPLMGAWKWFRARNLPSTLGSRTVTLTPDHVVAVGTGYDISVTWPKVYKVTHRLGLLMFWTGPQGGLMLPDSAFADKAAAAAFHAEAVRLLAAGKASAAKSTLDG